jgi:hypothetical protein
LLELGFLLWLVTSGLLPGVHLPLHVPPLVGVQVVSAVALVTGLLLLGFGLLQRLKLCSGLVFAAVLEQAAAGVCC